MKKKDTPNREDSGQAHPPLFYAKDHAVVCDMLRGTEAAQTAPGTKRAWVS